MTQTYTPRFWLSHGTPDFQKNAIYLLVKKIFHVFFCFTLLLHSNLLNVFSHCFAHVFQLCFFIIIMVSFLLLIHFPVLTEYLSPVEKDRHKDSTSLARNSTHRLSSVTFKLFFIKEEFYCVHHGVSFYFQVNGCLPLTYYDLNNFTYLHLI